MKFTKTVFIILLALFLLHVTVHSYHFYSEECKSCEKGEDDCYIENCTYTVEIFKK